LPVAAAVLVKVKRMPRSRGGFSFLRVVGGAMFLLAAGAAFFGAAWRMDFLQKQAQAAKKSEDERTITEDAALFQNLLETRLLVPRADTGLDMAAKDYVLVKRATGDRSDEEDGISQQEQDNLLKELYDSAPGRIVQRQVQLWNNTRRLAGIRDNRSLARDGRAVEWTAQTESGHPLRADAQIPETFGFIHKDNVSVGFGDWTAVATDARRVVFKGRVRGGSGELVLQVVGEAVQIPPGARVEKREANFADIKSVWPCRIATKAGVVRVPVRGDGEISITVEPATNCAPRIFGLAISMAGEDLAGNQPTKRRKGRRGKPGAKDPGKVTIDTVEWSYAWRPVARPTPTAAGRFTLRTADGVLLTDASGRGTPSEEAHALGLLPLVGFGRSDASSLIGMLAQSRLPAGGIELTLTIDSRIQRVAQTVVSHYYGKEWARTKHAEERRAAVMLMDADTGALIAMGNWPQPPANAAAWDYVSYATANPLRDPMAVQSWEIIDKHNTPGSTFKTIVALAMSKVNDPRTNRAMIGLTAGEMQREMGIGPGTSTYTIPNSTRSISNFGRGGLSFGGPLADPGCQGVALTTLTRGPDFAKNDDSIFGVAKATKYSINVYFARLAVMLEEAEVERFVRAQPVGRDGRITKKVDGLPPTRLLRALAEIGIDHADRMDLSGNVPESLGLRRTKSRTGADTLYAQVPRTHITTGEPLGPDQPSVWRTAAYHRIALNGIGQGWSVSVMHMARGAASIASGKKVIPHVFARWGEEDVRPKPSQIESLNLNPQVIGELRRGMKAVPEAAGSTAIGTFRSTPKIFKNAETTKRPDLIKEANARSLGVRCRSYGKTGTADVGQGLGYNSGWFVGWKDPIRPGGRRIAFACMTTHAIGAFRFGGGSCGQVMRDILTSIEAIESPEVPVAGRPAQPDKKAEEDEEKPRDHSGEDTREEE
jgi:cell division protein FtsI/penicillin-binding protein 2